MHRAFLLVVFAFSLVAISSSVGATPAFAAGDHIHF